MESRELWAFGFDCIDKNIALFKFRLKQTHGFEQKTGNVYMGGYDSQVHKTNYLNYRIYFLNKNNFITYKFIL